jgi:hypothetical protein
MARISLFHQIGVLMGEVSLRWGVEKELLENEIVLLYFSWMGNVGPWLRSEMTSLWPQ